MFSQIKDTNGTTSASGLCMLEDNLFSKTRATTKCTQNGSHASRTTYVQWDKFCNTAPITTSIINSSTCIEQPCCSSKAVLPTFCPPPWKTSDASSSYSCVPLLRFLSSTHLRTVCSKCYTCPNRVSYCNVHLHIILWTCETWGQTS